MIIPSLTGIFSGTLGAPTSLTATATTIGTLVGGPVGGAIGSAIGVLEQLAKRKTQHLSLDEVAPSATEFSRTTVQLILKTYGSQSGLEIARQVAPRFAAGMRQRWGLSGLNESIYRDVQQNLDLERQLRMFIIWVGTNYDKANPEEFTAVVEAFFKGIFIEAIKAAGYDPAKLDPSATPGKEPYPTITPAGPGQEMQVAGTGFPVLAAGLGVLGAGAIAFALFRRKAS